MNTLVEYQKIHKADLHPKGGRELAEVSRPNTKEPPIMIISDGTVF